MQAIEPCIVENFTQSFNLILYITQLGPLRAGGGPGGQRLVI